MKKIIFFAAAALAMAACSKPQLVVTVENDTDSPMLRMQEVDYAEVAQQLGDTPVMVLDGNGHQLTSQLTHDGKLIFLAAVDPNASASYRIVAASEPVAADTVTVGAVYPDRLDDLAWENDLVGFRAYGPGLQRRGERGYGYDLFLKRGTTEPVLADMYAGQLSSENWDKVNSLRREGLRAEADSVERSFTYHVDHGYGMDCYGVGPTLGAGVSALINDAGEIVYPWAYDQVEILDNGPLRFTAKLVFTPIVVDEDSAVVETRLITLDAGDNLNRTVVSYDGLSREHNMLTGIVLHDSEGAITMQPQQRYMSYVDPTQGPDNGKVFVGAVFEVEPDSMAVRFDEKASHVAAYKVYAPADEYTYYWGFGWDRANMPTIDAWNAYLDSFKKSTKYEVQGTK